MNKSYTKHLLLLPLFVLLQVFVLNEILFFRYINPYLYLILIISFPLKTPKWFLLSYAFTLGFIIDLFSYSLGFHSTAIVFMAFVKNIISKILKYMYSCNADIVIVPVQDLLQLDATARLNTPGEVGSPNWEWKLENFNHI